MGVCVRKKRLFNHQFRSVDDTIITLIRMNMLLKVNRELLPENINVKIATLNE